MIKIEHLEIAGLEPAIRGMRNPMNSWDKSDTTDYENNIVGEADLDLMKRLSAAGTDHAKYRRMIVVYMDITAPFFWWKEFDTYKVGTVANSCSTMHKIHSKPITIDDFSYDDTAIDGIPMKEYFQGIVSICEGLRKKYVETKDQVYWRALIHALPSCYLQKRTVMLNYEVLANMYKSRKQHKLSEWREFCQTMKDSLPYSNLFTLENDETDINL